MKVSFLVTYYNQKKYVKTSMESILALNKPCEWEIIVGDDGSTDGTLDEVGKYIEMYPDNIKLCVMPREGGKNYDSVLRASANRLKILEESTGDFFCCLDGDDYYSDIDFLKDALDIFHDCDSVSAVLYGYQWVDDEGRLIENKVFRLPEELEHRIIDKKEYICKYYIHAGAAVHRKSWGGEQIDKISQIGYFDDNDILLNDLNYGNFYCNNRVIYSYRQTGTSVFTSMQALEQDVLNVLGMDVDRVILDKSLADLLFLRNAFPVMNMYVWKRDLKKILGEEKYDRYLQGFCKIPDSFGRLLMEYDAISNEKKKYVKKKVRSLEKLYIKSAGKMHFMHLFRG